MFDRAMISWTWYQKQARKEKKNNLDYIKNFCGSKETTNKVKTKFMEWPKIFANHIIWRSIHIHNKLRTLII